ncbi:hypothetical protein E2P81_ATG11035 [Venturia nashicola]|uniref:Uncharacterized protein n=1 Tax=Venturia nashicola TaxID=86259 RepID=A0A4Z1NQ18_9PEZI|nr:hypothetical protein E6O75_ATG10711 [Venturia nashicola]TLD27747.1 hypothetical protein E2P81_ATG11035 [Venturia nashicola]
MASIFALTMTVPTEVTHIMLLLSPFSSPRQSLWPPLRRALGLIQINLQMTTPLINFNFLSGVLTNPKSVSNHHTCATAVTILSSLKTAVSTLLAAAERADSGMAYLTPCHKTDYENGDNRLIVDVVGFPLSSSQSPTTHFGLSSVIIQGNVKECMFRSDAKWESLGLVVKHPEPDLGIWGIWRMGVYSYRSVMMEGL